MVRSWWFPKATAAGRKLRRSGLPDSLLRAACLRSSPRAGDPAGRAFLAHPKRWWPRQTRRPNGRARGMGRRTPHRVSTAGQQNLWPDGVGEREASTRKPRAGEHGDELAAPVLGGTGRVHGDGGDYAHAFLLLRRAAEGTGESRHSREPGEGPLVLPRTSGTRLLLGVHGRTVDPGHRFGRSRADPFPRPPFRGRGRLVWHARREIDLLAVSVLRPCRDRRHVGADRELRLAAQLVSQHSPALDHCHQSRLLAGAYLRSLVAAHLEAKGLGAPGCGLAVYLFPGQLHVADLFRHRPSRT